MHYSKSLGVACYACVFETTLLKKYSAFYGAVILEMLYWENGRLVTFIYDGDKAVLEGTDSSTIRHIRGYELVSSDSEAAKTYDVPKLSYKVLAHSLLLPTSWGASPT